MLTKVTITEMAELLRHDHPCWDESAIQKYAKDYIATMDASLDEPLYTFIHTGKISDTTHQNYSLLAIRAIRGNCSYLEAAILMDAYIKDPSKGKLLIQRRF